MIKNNKIIIILAIVFFAIALVSLGTYIINYQGASLYSSIYGPGGRIKGEKFKNIPTEELLRNIKTIENSKKYSTSHFMRYIKGEKYSNLLQELGLRTEKIALDKLTEIVYTYAEGTKWTVITSVGKYKNKAMVPVLCEALKKHTDNHTDWLIVKALSEIDDPSALNCLMREKDNLKLSYAYEAAEKAIKRWQKQ